MTAEYLVPFAAGEAEYIEKRSRFIGRVIPVESEAAAQEILAEIRKEHWDASHNVYAYSIRGGATRFSDDGEPSGTAGRPVLEVFTREEITNYICIVTRYFGGVLLGAGGLVRAYAHSAKLALAAAGIAAMRPVAVFDFNIDYPLFERVKLEIAAADGTIENTEYGADVHINAFMPRENAAGFSLRMTEISVGALRPEPVAERFLPVRL